MSVDVALLQPCGHVCLVEADGSSHFQEGIHDRNKRDLVKDQAIQESGLSMLRLHYKDESNWHLYLQEILDQKCCGVRYTAAYSLCIENDQ